TLWVSVDDKARLRLARENRKLTGKGAFTCPALLADK
ncbi:MAG: hypothetical protein ACJAWY_003488, partial [Sphingomonas echinoides]